MSRTTFGHSARRHALTDAVAGPSFRRGGRHGFGRGLDAAMPHFMEDLSLKSVASHQPTEKHRRSPSVHDEFAQTSGDTSTRRHNGHAYQEA